MQLVDVGETWPVETAWWNADGDATEPSAIGLTITAPDGTVSTPDKSNMVTPDAAPDPLYRWTYMLLLDQEGAWRVEATGTVDGLPVTLEPFLVLAGPASKPPGPCEPWATWDDVAALCPGVAGLDELEPGAREQLLDIATWIVYSLDGRRYPGICVDTIEVCRTCTAEPGRCRCGTRHSIDLGPGWPVHAVWDVTIDGDVLPQSAHRVTGRRWLERLDGSPWPACGTAFTLTRAAGRRPPVGLARAAAILASEMAKSCVGAECELPERVTSLSREGVSYVVLDSQKFLDEGRTGVTAVDMALAASRAGRTPGPGAASPYAADRGR